MILLTRSDDEQFVRELVESAYDSRYNNLTKMLSFSGAAVAAVEEAGRGLPPDLVVAAWTHRGNALRITGQYDEAAKALEQVAELVPRVEEPARLEWMEVRASLHRNTGRLDKAFRLLCTVAETLDLQRSASAAARASNLLGIVLLDMGRRPLALRWFRFALDLSHAGTPADVVVSAGHNLIEALLAEGRYEEAVTAMLTLEPSYQRFKSARITAKAAWLRARLCRAVDQMEAAGVAYERAHAAMSLEPRSPELFDLEAEMAGLGLHRAPRLA